MDTLDLVLANDDVLESTTVLDHEDSVLVTTLDLTSAADTTAVGLHASIKSTADLLRGLESDGTLGGRDREGSTLAKSKDIVGSGSRRGGGSKASDGGNGSDGELHCDGNFSRRGEIVQKEYV